MHYFISIYRSLGAKRYITRGSWKVIGTTQNSAMQSMACGSGPIYNPYQAREVQKYRVGSGYLALPCYPSVPSFF